jgi:hypothetical protein
MAVLNPPGALPGLARSIVNHLLTARASYDVARLTALFAPAGINTSEDWTRGVDNTLSAARAIGLIETPRGGTVVIPEAVRSRTRGRPFTRPAFRRLLRELVLDVRRDGDPWAVDDEARTAGARDLNRALSWFLAQDALGPAMSWTGPDEHNVERLQSTQLQHLPDEDRPILNDTRWGAFGRWVLAMGLGEPAPTRGGGTGIVPLPLEAIRDVALRMERRTWPVAEFLDALATALPVLDGGVFRDGLRTVVSEEPDPGVRAHAVDSSIAQAVLLLEEERCLELTYGSDAEARVFMDPAGDRKVINVEILNGTRS